MRNDTRVVVTGMGAMTPLGQNMDTSWQGVVEGRTVTDRITGFDVEGSHCKIASEIQYDYIPLLKDLFPKKIAKTIARRNARFSHFALLAATEALQQADLFDEEMKLPKELRAETGVAIGTGGGAIDEIARCAQYLNSKKSWTPDSLGEALGTFVQSAESSGETATFTGLIEYAKNLISQGRSFNEQEFRKFLKVMRRDYGAAVLKILSDSSSFRSSIAFGAERAMFSTVNACATGATNIGLGYDMIQRDRGDIWIVGGSDASVNPVGIWIFSLVGAMSARNDDPRHASRPFDAERDGFVMGEGGAVLVLETLKSAKRRGVPILAELVEWDSSNDAAGDTEPNSENQALAMGRALQRGGIAPKEVGYINAHGTSTPIGDPSETGAIKRVLGAHAYHVTVSSVKSSVGHLIGAAGAFEAACTVRTIQEGVIPPTINYETPDPSCDLDYVPNKARRQNVDVALSSNFGFGGQNACLVFKKFEE